MPKISCLIVDDEALARQRLAGLLAKEPDVEVVATCRSGHEAIAAIQQHQPDVVFLDIQMRGLTGIEVLEQIPELGSTQVVFVTAYDEYAVRAFELHALDYLLKPYSDERFAAALNRARKRLRDTASSAYVARIRALIEGFPTEATPLDAEPATEGDEDRVTGAYANRIVVRSGGRKVFLRPDDVDWIEGEGVYVRLHAGTKSYLLRETLNNVEARLDPDRFLRIHRSTVVNVDRIQDITQHVNGGSIVRLVDGTTLRMSRSYQRRVRITLG